MLWASLALATTPDWEVVKESGDCSFARGPEQQLVASCLWPEVDPKRLDELLSDYAGAQAIWQSVELSELRGDPVEGATPVFHVHSIPGLADREILLLWTRSEEDGAVRHSWSRAPDQPKPAEGRVNVPEDQGYYLLRPEAEGTALEALFVYEPGGSIPDWVVWATQVTSASVMLEELRAAAARPDSEEAE